MLMIDATLGITTVNIQFSVSFSKNNSMIRPFYRKFWLSLNIICLLPNSITAKTKRLLFTVCFYFPSG